MVDIAGAHGRQRGVVGLVGRRRRRSAGGGRLRLGGGACGRGRGGRGGLHAGHALHSRHLAGRRREPREPPPPTPRHSIASGPRPPAPSQLPCLRERSSGRQRSRSILVLSCRAAAWPWWTPLIRVPRFPRYGGPSPPPSANPARSTAGNYAGAALPPAEATARSDSLACDERLPDPGVRGRARRAPAHRAVPEADAALRLRSAERPRRHGHPRQAREPPARRRVQGARRRESHGPALGRGARPWRDLCLDGQSRPVDRVRGAAVRRARRHLRTGGRESREGGGDPEPRRRDRGARPRLRRGARALRRAGSRARLPLHPLRRRAASDRGRRRLRRSSCSRTSRRST